MNALASTTRSHPFLECCSQRRPASGAQGSTTGTTQRRERSILRRAVLDGRGGRLRRPEATVGEGRV